ncbi:MAG: transporter permease [Verrucomicrobiales bacterium]|jgi:branched-chain amino acid transport system permease protein|nr:transporter permease [Verrucomicrobiales bacterium]
MSEFLQQLVNGLSLGSMYALIALGYTMVYGVLRFINFAHSDVFMVGAFIGFYVAPQIQHFIPTAPIFGGVIVLLISMCVCALLGVIIERLAYKPLRERSKLTVLITAIGVSLLLEYGGQKVFGPSPKYFELLPSSKIHVGTLVLGTNQIIVFILAPILLLVLRFIVMRTKIGTAMRALSFNAQAASLVGINNDVVISFTFAIGSALAAAGGILYAQNYPKIEPLMGILPGLKAFVAAVLGGIGNIPGAAFGGLLIGVVETLVAGTRFSTYRDAIAFAILIGILLFKPSGLLGKSQVEKV